MRYSFLLANDAGVNNGAVTSGVVAVASGVGGVASTSVLEFDPYFETNVCMAGDRVSDDISGNRLLAAATEMMTLYALAESFASLLVGGVLACCFFGNGVNKDRHTLFDEV